MQGLLLVAAQFALIGWLLWPFTPQTWSPPAMLLAGAASGFIGSVVGTSSPPQLFAFTYLDLTKGAATPSAPARAH